MRIISRRVLREFELRHPDAGPALADWVRLAKHSSWRDGAQVRREASARASILRDSRVVFDIGGNKHRLVVRIDYPRGIIYIRFIGTHSEYDKIDAERI